MESAAPVWPPSQPHALGDQPPRPGGKRPSKQAPATEATCKLPRQGVIYPTRPAIVSITEQVASIGRPNIQQQSTEPNRERMERGASRSYGQLQYLAPVLPSPYCSNTAVQQNNVEVSSSDKRGHATAQAPLSHSYDGATQAVSPTNLIMMTPHEARPKMNLERPRYQQEGVNQNIINKIHNDSHTKNAIRVKNSTQLHITPQKINNENMIDPNQQKIHQLDKIKLKQEAIRKMFHNSKFKYLLDSKMYRPYSKKPVFIASFATRSKKPTFKCLACDYKTRGKSHFIC